ncbi:MAG TPA: L,D-transpeptidase [Sandaracinaceae bacterium]
MKRSLAILLSLLGASIALAAALSLAFGDRRAEEIEDDLRAGAGPQEPEIEALPGESEEDLARRRREAHEAMLNRDYPLHGLVTAAQIVVRREADPQAPPVGWLRLGGRVRLKREPTRTPTCSSGWYELYPRGFACAGRGIEIGETPPVAPAAEAAADTSSALPYRYYLVREPQVPEYHRLPSRDEQRAALAHRDRYLELLNGGDERRARLLREGRLGEPAMPEVVARYLERGFYVASNAVEVRAFRRFVRTVRNSYVKEAQLLETTGADFAGVELDEETTLPIAWAVRAARPMRRVVAPDGTERFVDDDGMEPWERLARVPWLRRERHGAHVYHVLEGPDGEPRYVRAWFVGVAERIDPPRGVEDDEPWVHVDVSEQTLVVYRGATPIYATLVSTGLAGHDTPIGEFTIRRKFVSDTMANLGPDAGDDSYRIEDVPWTQYFQGSIALHGAFWHARFGLRRSHGCVNLAPRDARWVYEHTWPEVPEGWHGVSTEGRSGFRGSRVVVTE